MNRVGERKALFASLFLSAWKKTNPRDLFAVFFFQKEEKTATIFFIFSLLAVENKIKGHGFFKSCSIIRKKLQNLFRQSLIYFGE